MQTIYIYFDDFRVETPVLMGRLFAQPTRGKEIFSFEFEPEWLQTPYCRLLDPDLQLFRGRQFWRMTRPTLVFSQTPLRIDGGECCLNAESSFDQKTSNTHGKHSWKVTSSWVSVIARVLVRYA